VDVVPVVARIGEAWFHQAGLTNGIGLTQFLALQCLAAGPLSAGRLSHALGVTRATATELVDSLVDGGLATRSRPADDRRLVIIALTDCGRTRYAEVDAALHRHVGELVGRLDEGAQRRLLAALVELDGIIATAGLGTPRSADRPSPHR
jgi:DNA-binding MarR family transcriptional regulator